MGKAYKGYELYRMIANGEIKRNSQFKDNNNQIWNWNGFDFISEYNYNDYVFSLMDFEILEDEETDIEELKFTEECVREPSDLSGVGRLEYKSVSQKEMQNKINEIIRVVNKMQKEMKELEKDDGENINLKLDKAFHNHYYEEEEK